MKTEIRNSNTQICVYLGRNIEDMEITNFFYNPVWGEFCVHAHTYNTPPATNMRRGDRIVCHRQEYSDGRRPTFTIGDNLTLQKLKDDLSNEYLTNQDGVLTIINLHSRGHNR